MNILILSNDLKNSIHLKNILLETELYIVETYKIDIEYYNEYIFLLNKNNKITDDYTIIEILENESDKIFESSYNLRSHDILNDEKINILFKYLNIYSYPIIRKNKHTITVYDDLEIKSNYRK